MFKTSPERGKTFKAWPSSLLVHIPWVCCWRIPSSSWDPYPFSTLLPFSGLGCCYCLTIQFKTTKMPRIPTQWQALCWVWDPIKETVVNGISISKYLLPLPVKELYSSLPLTSDLIMQHTLANEIWAEVICHFWAEAFEDIFWSHSHFAPLSTSTVICPE